MKVTNQTTTSVTLANQANTLLMAPASVGTPERTFLLAIDTSASDLWILTDIWGEDPSDPLIRNATYGPNATRTPAELPEAPSSSFRSTNRSFASTAVTGAAVYYGYQGTDVVTFAGRTLEKAYMDINSHSSNGQPAFPAVGVMGLGWAALANGMVSPFWQATGAGIFSLHLMTSPSLFNVYANGGTLYLGPPPAPAPEPSPNASSPYTGSITYHPLAPNHTSTWSLTLTSLLVSNSSIPFSSSSSSSSSSSTSLKGAEALIDSATNTIAVPDAVASAFYSRVRGAEPVPLSPGFWWYPCNHTDAIPQPIVGQEDQALNVTLSFALANSTSKAYVIPDGLFGIPTTMPAAGNIAGFDGSGSSTNFELDGLVKCVGTLYGYGNLTKGAVSNSTTLNAADSDAADLFIVGLPFLRSVFSVFDGTTSEIGFAQLSDDPLSPTALAEGEKDVSWRAAYQAGEPDRNADGTPDDDPEGSRPGSGSGMGSSAAGSGAGRMVRGGRVVQGLSVGVVIGFGLLMVLL
ncbi:hypothetical protein CF319_g7294 [Tilletia indica]|nr:hypothetical protein CF319_g7294 [Tilletia indica]